MDKFDLPYVNKITISGRVAREPEYRQTNSGQPVCNFRIIAHKRYHDTEGRPKEETCYVGVAAWHTLAENCRKYLQKGTPVQIDGELKSRVRDSNDGVRRSFVEIRALRIRVYRADGSFEDLRAERNQAPMHESAVESAPSQEYRPERDESPFQIADSGDNSFEPVADLERDEL